MDAKEASTVKRIAGNIASGCVEHWIDGDYKVGVDVIARDCVDLACAINDEVNRRVAAATAVGTSQPSGREPR